MKPMLQAASNASHELTSDTADEDDFNHDRIMELGMLTDMASQLCPAQLHLLVGVVFALLDLNHDDKEHPVKQMRPQ